MGNLGELAALGTAMCWTITALSFESAGKRVGSLSVNLIRLWIAFGLLTLYSLIFRGVALPVDAGSHAWLWLSLSGLVGFVIGDLFLFQAFVLIGARISMLVFSAVPPITAFIGWLALGEMLTLTELLGIALTTGGIAAVVGQRQAQEEVTAAAGADDVATTRGGEGEYAPDDRATPGAAGAGATLAGHADQPSQRRRGAGLRGLTLKQSVIGALFALGGAVGQAGGLVLSRHGVGDYNPFAATQIRGIAGIIGFSVLFTILRRWHKVGEALRNGPAMRRISLGAFFGPFLGVSLSLLAVQNTTAGIASTIMALVPVLIIPPAAIIFRERVRVLEVIAALVAVTGVSLLFLT
jgi:drug/metabolite transporter (DMT)-like permease